VTELGYSAFRYCSNLTTLVIGSSVERLMYHVFDGYDNLTEVYDAGNESTWSQITMSPENDIIKTVPRYDYSATQPTEAGNYWHYVDGVPTKW
jgi:hypothetical protein